MNGRKETTEPVEVEAAIVKAEPGGAVQVVPTNPFDLDPKEFAAALAVRKQNRKSLIDWIREALVEGVDFGKIHVVSKNKCQYAERRGTCPIESHYSKPSLFKPGAEKICGMLGLTVRYPNIEAYEQRVLDGLEVKQIILKCELVNAAGAAVAQGTGARSLRQDYDDLNKSFKMAQKSGHIDATLRLGGLSELFTQDVEDMVEAGGGEPHGAVAERGGSDAAAPPARPPKTATKPIRTEGSQADWVAMVKQIGEELCKCGGDLVVHFDTKGQVYASCSRADEAYRNANTDEEKNRVREENRNKHSFKRLRKDPPKEGSDATEA